MLGCRLKVQRTALIERKDFYRSAIPARDILGGHIPPPEVASRSSKLRRVSMRPDYTWWMMLVRSPLASITSKHNDIVQMVSYNESNHNVADISGLITSNQTMNVKSVQVDNTKRNSDKNTDIDHRPPTICRALSHRETVIRCLGSCRATSNLPVVCWRGPDGRNLQVKIPKGGQYLHCSVPELLKGMHNTWREFLGQVEIPDGDKWKKELLPLAALDIILPVLWRE